MPRTYYMPTSELSIGDRTRMWLSLCEKEIADGTILPQVFKEYVGFAPRFYSEHLLEIAMKTKTKNIPKLIKKLNFLSKYESKRLRKLKSEKLLKPLTKKQKIELEDDIKRVEWGYSRAQEPLARLGLTRKLLNLASEGFDISEFEEYLRIGRLHP